MNDVDNEVIARNIILLEIISAINPDDLSDVEYLWDVWYNMTLTEGHHARLKVTLERLLDGSSSSLWNFGDSETKKRVSITWKSWLETEPWDVESIKKCRQDVHEFYIRRKLGKLGQTLPSQPFYQNTLMEVCMEKFADNLTKDMAEWDRLNKAGIARDFVSHDSTSNTVEFINPTMMRPGSNKWHVHYGANPVAAYVPFERYRIILYIILVVLTC